LSGGLDHNIALLLGTRKQKQEKILDDSGSCSHGANIVEGDRGREPGRKGGEM